jgi:hypothetical protein
MGTQDKQDKQEKIVPNAKYGVTMSELFKLRVTAEQKRSLHSATADMTSGSASHFWREYDVYSAEQLLKLQAGDITPDEFGGNIADFVQSFMSATMDLEQDDKTS